MNNITAEEINATIETARLVYQDAINGVAQPVTILMNAATMREVIDSALSDASFGGFAEEVETNATASMGHVIAAAKERLQEVLAPEGADHDDLVELNRIGDLEHAYTA